MSFYIDENMGKINENKVYNIICKYWTDRQISMSDNKYCNYDFFCQKYKYELKSRRVNHNKYDTTMIPVMKCNKKTYLLFLFTDGLYYIKYKEDKFNKYEKKMFVKNRDDKKDVKKEYYYIPISDLKKVIIKNEEINENEFTVEF